MNPTYTYKDISLVPRKLSEIHSRDDVDLSQEVTNLSKTHQLKISLPVIPSPMETIATPEMCNKLDDFGMWSTIHRFGDQNRFEAAALASNTPPLFSVGVGKEEFPIVESLIFNGCRYFNIDIANGFNTIVEPIINHIRKLCPATFIMCGNVASREGFMYLADLGVDCVRVGIGNGCFVPDTLVKTSNGTKKISDVNIDDKVLTHRGRWKKVKNKKIEHRREKMIKINDKITSTKNHEFYVIDKKDKDNISSENIHNYAKWVSAKDITAEHMLIKSN